MKTLNIYFVEDIENILKSLTGKGPPLLVKSIRGCDDPKLLADFVETYQHGYADALRDVARAVGVEK